MLNTSKEINFIKIIALWSALETKMYNNLITLSLGLFLLYKHSNTLIVCLLEQ